MKGSWSEKGQRLRSSDQNPAVDIDGHENEERTETIEGTIVDEEDMSRHCIL